MLLSLNWLKEFVPYAGTAEELGERLTMLGLELEEVQRPYDGIRDVVAGRVLTCEMHPDSDHLHVCTVDVGEGEPLTIVCGAPNVAAGQLVPVAPVGAKLPGGLEIKKAKLRGVPSFGMICSERELGLTDDHSGILVLPETNRAGRKIELGKRLVDELDFDQEVLDISITPNRADCLSVLGFAREVAAAFGLPLTLPRVDLKEEGDDASASLLIEIKDPDHCPAYTGRMLEGVKVMPSPAWMRWRLHSVGVRPISNLVDVTNYILMELGQPLHAFDHNKLTGGRIIVRRAEQGEKLVTLDGQERALEAGDGLICDAERPVALAGVMGGLATEISDETGSVFIECALFKPQIVRRTSRRLGLSSESSYRYERGVDQTGMAFALDRAAALMAELSGGRVLKGVCRSEPKPYVAPVIRFRRSKAEDLLGVELDDAFCSGTLKALGCGVEQTGEGEWKVSAPGWRYDLYREADLIEEAARFKGVDSMPATLPAVRSCLESFGRPEGKHGFMMRVKHWAAGMGLNEAVNYSFVGNRDLDLLHLPQEGRVNIMNPLSAEQDVLRTELAPGLLQNVRHNIAQGAAGLRLFEVAESFRKDPASETGVHECRRMGFVLYGNRYDSAWPHADEDVNYTDLKGIIRHFFLNFLHLSEPVLNVMPAHPYLAPAVLVSADGREAGIMGRVRPDMADAYHARKDVWLADLDLDLLRELASGVQHSFHALPVFPPVRRDVTVRAKAGIKVEDIVMCLRVAGRGSKNPILESVELIDLYEPKGERAGAEGERNLTFRMTFRHAERTLQDAEVDKEREKIVAALVQALPVAI